MASAGLAACASNPARRLSAAVVVEVPCSEGHEATRLEAELLAKHARERIAVKPEYVLSPENPLTFLSPDQPCSFFGV